MELSKRTRFLLDYKIIFILAGMLVIMSALSPFFFNATNLMNIFSQVSIYGIVACAMTIAIICGEFDLSVGSTFGLSTVLFVMLGQNIGAFPAFLIVVGVGLGIGLINGLMVSVGVNSFIATLATMIAVKGLALTVTAGEPVQWFDDTLYEIGNGNLGGVPYLVLIFIAAIIVTELVLKYTVFGRNIFATGANMETARYSNINVKFYKIIIFVILGGATAVAGMLLACRMGAGLGIYGDDLSLYVVAAVVVGGTSLSGGKGSAIKTLMGLFFMGVLFNGLNMMNVSTYYQLLIRGAIVIAVIVLDRFIQRIQER